MYYNNYHKHTHYSNIKTIDVVVKIEDYLDRMVELGHTNYFTTEHGYQGNLFDVLNAIEKKNKDLPEEKHIRMIVGSELYYVKDINSEEKDRGNYHLIMVAMNNNGVEQINEILSYANIDGYYYKPRVDRKMIEDYVNPNDVIVTSACVAGIGAEWCPYAEDNIKWFKEYFGDNFYLEIQSHNHPTQIKHNVRMKNFSSMYGIQLIHANDSHYILPEDSIYRDLFLKGKGFNYPEEDGFVLDYPDYQEIVKRYDGQGIFSNSQILKAIDNTLVFDKCEDITIYNKEIKIPKISENPNKELKELINNLWVKEKENIPRELRGEYLKAIRDETKIIEDTYMEEYFLIDQKITERAKKRYNTYISPTSRGSAGSFYVNKLLDIIGMDRMIAPVTLYPTRFMSTTRILESKSLPDIDINTSNRDGLIKASEDILGEEYCGWLITYKPLKMSGAFRLWCKAKDIPFNEYNEFAKHIAECESKGDNSYLHDEKWKNELNECKVFVGVIESISPSPCSMVLSTERVPSHFGLIKIKDQICCNLDKTSCDDYKYLKNDYLKVTVYEIVENTCELANIPIPTINELTNLLDEQTFKIYEKGLTCTVNQADSDFATPLVMKYKPKSVSEVCAFVAAIRPGFKSLLHNFLERKPYTTGVQELDNLLEDSFHYMLYQESIMKYLIWLGVEESETYTIIKKISKKKFKEDELKKLKAQLHKGWVKVVGREEGFEQTWQVVEDASKYSFNASHSLAYAYDSLYCAYLKAHYPLEYYSATLNLYEKDSVRTKKLINELSYFGIKIEKAMFRHSKGTYFFNKDTNTIYKGVSSIKGLNEETGEFLYRLRDKDLSFIDLISMKENPMNKTHFETLIKLDFFKEFGKQQYLLELYSLYKKYGSISQLKKDKLDFPISIAKECAGKETAKLFKEIDTDKLIKLLSNHINNIDLPKAEQISFSMEYTGTFDLTDELGKSTYIIPKIDEFKDYRLEAINVKSGNKYRFRAKKGVMPKLKENSIIRIEELEKTQKNVLEGDRWVKSKTEFDLWITKSKVIYQPEK